ncbi:MAG: DUF5689 domain-containing protein [Rikenellaceae bacterium]
MIRTIILLLLMVAVGCSPSPSSSVFEDIETPESEDSDDDDSYEPEIETDDYAPEVTSSIIALKSKYIGSTVRLTESMTISGQVVANDIRDEFTYTMILEDSTAAIEVSVDIDNIAYQFPLGCYVRLVCDGLWLGSRGGTIVIGEEPTGDSVVDMIDEDDISTHLYYVEQGAIPEPTFVEIGELNTSLVSCFIAIEDLCFLSAYGSTFCERDLDSGRSISTTHILESRDGEQIELFIASTTDYADDLIPSGYGNIYAILDLYAGSYSLRLIDRGIDF